MEVADLCWLCAIGGYILGEIVGFFIYCLCKMADKSESDK